MKMFTIPNLITLGNLLCGCIGIVFAFRGELVWAAYLVGIAAVLDFLDGFVARLLKSHSPIGKELDSLADMVTFGVLPGVVMFNMLIQSIVLTDISAGKMGSYDVKKVFEYDESAWLPYLGFALSLFSALRLAKFNVDTRQTESFVGVPTPANSILICSLPLILDSLLSPQAAAGEVNIPFHDVYWVQAVPQTGLNSMIYNLLTNTWFLLSLTAVMSFLLIAEIPLFALKFKKFGWKGNEIRYIFLGLSVLLFVFLKFIGIPLVIVLYVLLSLVNNLLKKKSPDPAA